MSRRKELEGYIYKGNAVALGGSLTKPVCDNIKSQAAVVLPSVGGYQTARVEKFRYKGILSFEAAYSQVYGNYDPRESEFDTVVTTTIEGLNILDMVKADAVVARLSSVYQGDPRDESQLPRISPLGSHFVNLRIAGRLCEAKIPIRDQETSTEYGKFCTLFSVFDPKGADKVPQQRQPRRRASLVQHSWPGGGPIEIPDFGRIYLGEFFYEEYSARLTMLRVELGCGAEGFIAGGAAESGGSGWP